MGIEGSGTVPTSTVRKGLSQFYIEVVDKKFDKPGFVSSVEEVGFADTEIESGITVRNDGLMVVGKLTLNGTLINNGTLSIQPEWA